MYDEKVVLCGANSYNQSYYLNPDFDNLPEEIKEELRTMCVLFVNDVGGILDLAYEKDGTLTFEVRSEEFDPMFDEIGSGLKIKKLQQEEEDLLRSMEMYYKIFVLGETGDTNVTDD